MNLKLLIINFIWAKCFSQTQNWEEECSRLTKVLNLSSEWTSTKLTNHVMSWGSITFIHLGLDQIWSNGLNFWNGEQFLHICIGNRECPKTHTTWVNPNTHYPAWGYSSRPKWMMNIVRNINSWQPTRPGNRNPRGPVFFFF